MLGATLLMWRDIVENEAEAVIGGNGSSAIIST
jgi:hypothetical protein